MPAEHGGGRLALAGECPAACSRWREVAFSGWLLLAGACCWRGTAIGAWLPLAGECRWGAAAEMAPVRVDPGRDTNVQLTQWHFPGLTPERTEGTWRV